MRETLIGNFRTCYVTTAEDNFYIAMKCSREKVAVTFRGAGFHIRGNVFEKSYDIMNIDNSVVGVVSRQFLTSADALMINIYEDKYFIENKDALPIADLSQIKSPYLYVTEEEIENKIVYFETSRGCTFNCSYCLSSTLKGVRFFPLESVKQDLKKLVDLNAKQIKFVDRTFNSHKEITLALIKFFIFQSLFSD